MRLLLSLLLVAPFSLLSARADDADSLDKARSLYLGGEYRRAIHTCDEILHDNPADKEVLRFRGMAHMALGQYKKGQQDFLSYPADVGTEFPSHPAALGADPNEVAAKALYNKGRSAFASGDNDTAATYFKQSLVLFPRCPDCFYQLAVVLNAKEDYDGAITDCIYALSYRPSDVKFWEGLSMFCKFRGQYKFSVAAANIGLSLNPLKGDYDTLKTLLETDRFQMDQVDPKNKWPSENNVDPLEGGGF